MKQELFNVDESKNELEANIVMYLAFMPAFLFGAQKQIVRYREEAAKLSINPVNAVYECLHEASNLIEDVVTVLKYSGLANLQTKPNSSWEDVRHHIRHDIREQLHTPDSRTISRQERLQMNPKLISEVGFQNNSFNVGGVHVLLGEIETYLAGVADEMYGLHEKAKAKGYISSNPLKKET